MRVEHALKRGEDVDRTAVCCMRRTQENQIQAVQGAAFASDGHH